MDDFKENSSENLTDTENFGDSTIFSAPKEHNDKIIKSPKKRKIISAISAFLSVCILVGGTLTVIKLIPKKEQETEPDENKIYVINFDQSELDTVTVDNENGQFVFYPKTEEGSDNSDKKWYVKSLPEEKISTSATGEIVSAVAKIEAVMEITKKSFEECGLNEPVLSIDVKSSSIGNYSLAFGAVSPDNSGIYLYSSVDEKIYLVLSDVFNSFNFTGLDLASIDAVSPTSQGSELSSYIDNGSLKAFDSLKISGSKYKSDIIIKQLSDKEAESIGLSYVVTSPINRYADTQSVGDFMSVFTSGISVSGVYSYDTDDAALKALGLDKPEISVTLNVDGKSFNYSFTSNDDGNYAAFGYGMDTIKKVSPSALTLFSVKEDDIYSKMVYIRSISEVKNMTFSVGDKKYSFNISENGEDEEEKYTVNYGKKRIKSDYFQNFYMHFVSLSLIDFSAKITGSADMTVTVTDNEDKTETISFYKSSATEYYCSVNGNPMGKITASSYDKLLTDIKTVSENKDVEV